LLVFPCDERLKIAVDFSRSISGRLTGKRTMICVASNQHHPTDFTPAEHLSLPMTSENYFQFLSEQSLQGMHQTFSVILKRLKIES
jgi:hypothetical protein